MAVPLPQFVRQLEESGLLSGDTLREFLPPRQNLPDAEALAKELVRHKKLTPFQVKQIWNGKGKSLTLGNYLILERIGAGGMGQVFKAEHRRMKRIVAVKILSPALMKRADVVARFEREITAAAKLNHPNIVTAYDADNVNGVHLLVMEYVEGRDLSAVVREEGPLRVAGAVECIVQAARGLEAAHAAGIVHRDIKPANLLLDREGTVKVLDLGLARIRGDDAAQAELTGTGTVMGTVDYMAPEQALSTKSADPRADIYSLGCTLHFLLTGQPAYGGESLMARLLAHRDHSIPALRAARSDVSEALEAVFQKMVAKTVEGRYQSMTEVISALDRCVAGAAPMLAAQPPVPTIADDGLTSLLEEIAQDAPQSVPLPVAAPRPFALSPRQMWLAGGVAVAALIVLSLVAFDRPGRAGRSTTEAGANQRRARPRNSQPVAEDKESAGPGWQGWPADAPAPAIAPFQSDEARRRQREWARYLQVPEEYANSLGMTFRLIPPGEFRMGCEVGQLERLVRLNALPPFAVSLPALRDATPSRSALVAQPFYLAADEVRNSAVLKVLGSDMPDTAPARAEFKVSDPEMPAMSNVSVLDAVRFCNALSEREDRRPAYEVTGDLVRLAEGADGYRLPTEAEWELACRAGTTTFWYFGDDPHGGDQPGQILKQQQSAIEGPRAAPNPFGLFDLYAGSDELCAASDAAGPGWMQWVRRGGSYFAGGGGDGTTINSVARETGVPADSRHYFHGFGRVALPVPHREPKG